jgi:hypothetical protein
VAMVRGRYGLFLFLFLWERILTKKKLLKLSLSGGIDDGGEKKRDREEDSFCFYVPSSIDFLVARLPTQFVTFA